MTSFARLAPTALAAPPRSHYDVILIVTSIATELATPSVTDVRTYGHLTAFNKDVSSINFMHRQRQKYDDIK